MTTGNNIYNQSLSKNQDQFRVLNQSLSDLINFTDVDSVYEHLANTLFQNLTDTVILILTVNNDLSEVELKHIKGIKNTLFEKITKKLNINPLGKHFKLLPNHITYFKQGKLIEQKNGLKEFTSEYYPRFAVETTQKLLKINKVYTIGINKEEHLFAAVHFFTLNNKIIEDFDFIESLVKQTAIIINRIQLKEELIESESKFYSLTNQLPVGIYRTSPDGKILFANTALAKMLEYDLNELYTISVQDLYIKKQDRDNHIESFKSNTEKYISNEIQLKTKSGRIIIVNDILQIVKDKKSKIKYFDGVLEDITSKKNTQKLLLESEEKYRFIAENINDYIWRLDNKFNITYISPSIKNILGYTPEEAMQWNLNDFLEQESLKAIKDIMLKCRNKVKNGVFDNTQKFWEFQLKHKNGSIVWIEMSTSPVYNENKEFIGLIGVNRDISERKNTQLALKENQTRYKVLTDLTVEGIIIHDDGIIIDANPSALKMTGFKIEQIIGKSILDYIHPDSLELVKSKITNKFSGIYEVSVICSDGSSIIVEIETKNVFIEGKEYRVVAFRNISERKQVEKEILKLSTAVTQSPASIVITNLYGDIEYVNPQFSKVTGYSYNEAIGKNPRILKSGYTSKEEYENLWKTISSGGMWKGEFHNKRKDGTLYWELATVSPIIDENGKLIQYIAVKEDITARKEADEALKQSEKELKHANATKDLFFSIIAHDLKGPVGNFVQFLELLTERSDEYSEYEKDEIIKTLFDLSIKTNDLLEDLLLWSRIQMNKIDLTPVNHNLSQILNSSLRIVNENAKKKNIEIINEVDESLVFFANDTSVKTILRNLLSNAIKFSRRNSKIVVSAKLNTTVQQNKLIEVSIADDGVGIPKEDINKLFKLETNISTYGTEKEKGTGLGLILCKELTEKNGGKISVESELNRGSIFKFTLPLG